MLSSGLAEVQRMTQNGSPALLQLVGRAFGLGEAEQAALGSGKIPGWVWLAAGLTAGVVVGSRVQKRWPEKVPKLIQG